MNLPNAKPRQLYDDSHIPPTSEEIQRNLYPHANVLRRPFNYSTWFWIVILAVWAVASFCATR